MKSDHDKRVSEPVQIYLDAADRERLERLRAVLGATKSDVLRRGLAALERQVTDPAEHPALRIIGIAGGQRRGPAPAYDIAAEHDRFLTESEVTSWRRGGKRRRTRG
jgi:hypothetical protein